MAKERKIKKCLYCSAEFTPHGHQKYCSNRCRQLDYKFHKPHYTPTVTVSETTTLSKWALEARACHMDYGNYRALVEKCGKTFEELRAYFGDLSTLKDYFSELQVSPAETIFSGFTQYFLKCTKLG